MIAVIGGLAAALCWALATIASAGSTRRIGAWSHLGWVMLVGAVAAAVPAALSRPEGPVEAGPVALMLFAGAAYVLGLLVNYTALRIGRISLVAPIVSTEGAIAAAIAVVIGDPIGLATAAALGIIVVGVVLSATGPRDAGELGGRPHADDRRAAILAVIAAFVFATGLVTSALAVAELPVAWVALAARLVGVVAVTVPLALRGRLRIVRSVVPLVVVAGVGEVVGTAIYTVGAQDSIAIAAVLASQFAAMAAVGGFIVFGERLTRLQGVGVVAVLVGVAIVTLVQV